MRVLAFDSETFLIKDRAFLQHGPAKIFTEPFEIPKIVLGSIHDSALPGRLLSPDDLKTELKCALEDPGLAIVCHNFPFDYEVVCQAFPDLRPLFVKALEAGRCYDTVQLDILYRLSTGYYDKPDPRKNWAQPDIVSRHLAELGQDYLGTEMCKDDAIRLHFGDWEGRLAELPESFVRYAIQDATVTYQLFEWFAQRPGFPWGAPAQTRANIALASFDRHGLRIDQAEAQRLHALFSKDVPGLQDKLVESSLGRYEPVPGTRTKKDLGHCAGYAPSVTPWVKTLAGTLTRVRHYKTKTVEEWAARKFVMDTTVLRGRLEAVASELEITPQEVRMTPGGDIGASVDEWADRIPADATDLLDWCDYAKLQKTLTAYLGLYSKVERVFPKWHTIAARTTRTSASSPAVQQIPKRKRGIRSLFVPEPGYVFVIADYAYQELITLAQAMIDLGIKGPLYESIQQEPHMATARLLTGKAEPSKSDRQAAKAVNFGVPGGLGARKLADYARKSYKVVWTEEEAKAMRRKFLDRYPDIQEYLKRHQRSFSETLAEASGHGLGWWLDLTGAEGIVALRKFMHASPDPYVRQSIYRAERGLTVTLRTGLVRKGCKFTEGANTRFQGMAAAVSKEALWRVYTQLSGVCRPVLLVHDEIVVETCEAGAEGVAKGLERCMLEAFRSVCPDVGHFAKVEVTVRDKWGSATDGDGEEIAPQGSTIPVLMERP